MAALVGYPVIAIANTVFLTLSLKTVIVPLSELRRPRLNITDYTDFSGSAADLATLAIACSKDFGLPVDPDKTNERLVRYYVSEGVIDRPDRVGRDAAYGYRHLLQLLTARRMLQAGGALSVIGPHNSTATTKALEEGLAKPLPTAAELLVSSFLQSKAEGKPIARTSPNPGLMDFVARSRPSKTPPPGPSIVDVLDEVRRIRSDWLAEVGKFQALEQGFQASARRADDSFQMVREMAQMRALETAQAARHEIGHEIREEILQALRGLQRRMDELHDRQEQQERWAQALHRLTTQNDQILQRLDELMGKVCPSAAAGQSKPPVKPTGN
jgi:hypothetical protein